MKIVIESQYLPNLEYMILLANSEQVILDRYEHYEKQSFRNRCEIRGANGVMTLSVPIVNGRSKHLVKDTAIDNQQPWQQQHWRSIQSAYGKSPFFEYYASYFKELILKPYSYLLDFNHDLLSLCLRLLSLDTRLEYSKEYLALYAADIQDFRSFISPKKDFKKRSLYKNIAYQQVFGSDFVPNLSVIDLLFCEGPQALSVIKLSTSSSLNK